MIEIPLSKRGKNRDKYVAIVDEEDKDLLDTNWSIFPAWNNGTIYAKCNVLVDGRYRTVKMHRIIMERMIAPLKLQKGEEVDHKDGNGLNNQRYNLRVTNRFGNSQNRRTPKNNSSGVKGVYKIPNGKYQTSIKANGVAVYIGTFSTIEEAQEAHQKKGEELHGEFFRKE